MLSFNDVFVGDTVTLEHKEHKGYRLTFVVQARKMVADISVIIAPDGRTHAHQVWNVVERIPAEPSEGSVIGGKAGKKGFVYMRTGSVWNGVGENIVYSWHGVTLNLPFGFTVLREGYGND